MTMAEDANLYRIKSVARKADSLRVVFNDGEILQVPLARISPPTGKADWSKISIERKGAHLVVPVSGGDFAEHEVPWDVLRHIGEQTNQSRRRPRTAERAPRK
jgi:hypothetical protein